VVSESEISLYFKNSRAKNLYGKNGLAEKLGFFYLYNVKEGLSPVLT